MLRGVTLATGGGGWRSVDQLSNARLVRRTRLSDEISAFTFAALDGAFVGCEAGAHVAVHLPGGLIRTYSLTEWEPDGSTASVAVKIEPGGRGGSVAMHGLDVGDTVRIAAPRNNFPLVTGDQPIVLIGGGIGITPVYAMARTLSGDGRPFDLHHLVRTRTAAAFEAPLRALGPDGGYHLHCDDVDGLPDFAGLLNGYPPDTHFYVCGPEVMLAAVLAARDASDRGTVFFERFAAAPGDDDQARDSFSVVLKSTGEEFEVPADTSILHVLRAAGREVDYACSEGACGTCITDVLEGEIDHRDSILAEEERLAGDCMCICVSRARSARLLLDL
ncbi:PDR/VanB family oxidoreductase [Streptomyces sp. NPDC091280]|uniref:PDR/VanB family oxidoreductase n=1 Tax=Streptomyces sp. NPDC091280 TaxID=3365984 RepID=UPI003814298C